MSRNYVSPEKLDGNYVFEGEDSVQIIGPEIGLYNTLPIAQQTITYSPAALEAYIDGTKGLDSAANMEALYDRVVELTAKVVELHTKLRNIGIIR